MAIQIVAGSIQMMNPLTTFEAFGSFPEEQKRLIRFHPRGSRSGSGLRFWRSTPTELIKRTEPGLYPLYDFTSSALNKKRLVCGRGGNARLSLKLEAISCRRLLKAISCRGGKVLLQSAMLQLSLEPVLCRRWKQLLAANAIKTEEFRLFFLPSLAVLERQIAGSANWNLSFAVSSEVNGNRSALPLEERRQPNVVL